VGGVGRSLLTWGIGDQGLGDEGRSLFDVGNKQSGLWVVRGRSLVDLRE
jgi:hypothetical protein